MNKFIIISLLVSILLMWSCDVKYDTTHTSNQILINTTKSKIIYAVSTDVGKDTIYSNGNDSSSVTFVKNSSINVPLIGPYSISIDKVYVFSKAVYLLNDTTSYVFDNYSHNKNDSIFTANTKFLATGAIFNEINFEKIIFTDELKQITQKDYTMLDKFKKYYKK